MAESCTICSSRSRLPVRKLLDTPSYVFLLRIIITVMMQSCYNEHFIQKLAYMLIIFEEVSNLNELMQGPEVNASTQNDKINADVRKLEWWGKYRTWHFHMFPNLEIYCPTIEIQANKNTSLTTWLLCRNIFHCSLKTLMSWNLNGLELHLPLTTSPD